MQQQDKENEERSQSKPFAVFLKIVFSRQS